MAALEREITIWGIHGGRTRDADSLFLNKNCVAIGWHEMGNLSELPANREAYKTKVSMTFPRIKPAAIPIIAGQLFRFVHEMKIGDLVAYHSKADRQIHIGRVTAEYKYTPQLEPSYPHLRPVTWLRAIPRTSFTQGALYEFGAGLTLFQLKNHADEFRIAVESTSLPSGKVISKQIKVQKAAERDPGNRVIPASTGISIVSHSQLAEWRRKLIRLLVELESNERRAGVTGLAERISRLQRSGLIPRETVAMMRTITEMRNAAEYESKTLTLAETKVVTAAWDALREWAVGRGLRSLD